MENLVAAVSCVSLLLLTFSVSYLSSFLCFVCLLLFSSLCFLDCVFFCKWLTCYLLFQRYCVCITIFFALEVSVFYICVCLTSLFFTVYLSVCLLSLSIFHLSLFRATLAICLALSVWLFCICPSACLPLVFLLVCLVSVFLSLSIKDCLVS
jgi:hypothetical protein